MLKAARRTGRPFLARRHTHLLFEAGGKPEPLPRLGSPFVGFVQALNPNLNRQSLISFSHETGSAAIGDALNCAFLQALSVRSEPIEETGDVSAAELRFKPCHSGVASSEGPPENVHTADQRLRADRLCASSGAGLSQMP
jgi:hypothetical protein